MIQNYLLALLLPPLMLIGWVHVQNAWRKRFTTDDEAGDVLAGRGDCGRCGCSQPCKLYEDDVSPEG